MSDQEETITITVTHNKKDHEITVPLTSSIKHFKNQVHRCTNVPPSLQKYILKSTVSNKVPKDASTRLKSREDDTMEQLGLKSGTKALLIGSTIDQVIAVTTPNVMSSTSSSSNLRKLQNTENDNGDDGKQGGIKLSEMKEHAKVVSKGVPTGAEVGDRNKDMPLPKSISNLYDKSGQLCRFTFKLEEQELWIATKERTEKIPFVQIRDIDSESIHSAPDYHVMSLQIGSSPNSKLWFYYIPAQYHKAIKYSVLGVHNFPFLMKQ